MKIVLISVLLFTVEVFAHPKAIRRAHLALPHLVCTDGEVITETADMIPNYQRSSIVANGHTYYQIDFYNSNMQTPDFSKFCYEVIDPAYARGDRRSDTRDRGSFLNGCGNGLGGSDRYGYSVGGCP